MFVTGLYNRTNNKHNRQTKLMISMGLSLGAEICDRGQEIVVEKSLHKRFTSRLGTQDDDVQDRTSTRKTLRETQEKRMGGVVVVGEVQCGGTDNTTTRTSTKVKSKYRQNNSQNTSTTKLRQRRRRCFDDDDGLDEVVKTKLL
jgi:hypothetical protein